MYIVSGRFFPITLPCLVISFVYCNKLHTNVLHYNIKQILYQGGNLLYKSIPTNRERVRIGSWYKQLKINLNTLNMTIVIKCHL